MQDLRKLSGPWIGQWVQRDVRGTMRMILQFHGNTLAGGGVDRDGPFTITGEIHPGSWRVRLRKAYSFLQVGYEGEWNGTFIEGRSIIGEWEHRERGTFELWPDREDLVTREQLMEATLTFES